MERQVYEIPEEYYVGGGGNRSGGFTIQTVGKNNEIITKYIETEICYKDDKNKMIYINGTLGMNISLKYFLKFVFTSLVSSFDNLEFLLP